MTESEWLASQDATKLLDCLRSIGAKSGRKLRLLACACARQEWHFLVDGRTSRAIAVAERFADGKASIEELDKARAAAIRSADPDMQLVFDAAWAQTGTTIMQMSVTATQPEVAWRDVVCSAAYSGPGGIAAAPDLVRDVFGNPFRSLPLSLLLLTWNGGVIRRLAQLAYEERVQQSGQLDSGHVGVLCDALEEAGADAGLVEHLRGPLHVRGCVGIDLILGLS
jgi:hypothetical protein